MNQEVNQKRTKIFGLGIMRLVEALPESRASDTIGAQLLRSGNTVGARYRAACRAFDRREALAQLRSAHDKADESLYLMELLVEGKLMSQERVAPLMQEAASLVQILRDEIVELQNSKPANPATSQP